MSLQDSTLPDCSRDAGGPQAQRQPPRYYATPGVAPSDNLPKASAVVLCAALWVLVVAVAVVWRWVR